jgi:hypothetical protein
VRRHCPALQLREPPPDHITQLIQSFHPVNPLSVFSDFDIAAFLDKPPQFTLFFGRLALGFRKTIPANGPATLCHLKPISEQGAYLLHNNSDIDSSIVVGIDVQAVNPCPYFVLNYDLMCVGSGWINSDSNSAVSERLFEILQALQAGGATEITLGIDAPRLPLPSPREHYWNGRTQQWRPRRKGEAGYGRHCEIVLKALNIANPQWTRLRDKCPDWMCRGFTIFDFLRSHSFKTFEVFPSASYSILMGQTEPKVTIDFAQFAPKPKDMIDACVAGVTVLEFLQGRGSEVGGGDGLGTIILPGPLPSGDHPVHEWPG